MAVFVAEVEITAHNEAAFRQLPQLRAHSTGGVFETRGANDGLDSTVVGFPDVDTAQQTHKSLAPRAWHVHCSHGII